MKNNQTKLCKKCKEPINKKAKNVHVVVLNKECQFG